MTVNGLWKFVPYPKKDDAEYEREQVRLWNNEVGNPIFFIQANSNDVIQKFVVDHGAVIVSEFDEMSWIFTTINTPKSNTQPFSGYRQFGILEDEDGYYYVFTRAIDRIFPDDGTKGANLKDMDATVKDYITIADSTWSNYMERVFIFIKMLGGCSTIIQPEISRINFHKFLEKYNTSPEIHIGNIPQNKYYEK